MANNDKLLSLEKKILEQESELQKREEQQPTYTSKPTFEPIADKQFLLGGMLLGFSLIIFFILASLIKKGHEIEQLLRAFGTIFVIVASIFLIVTGYSQEQIAPVIGLLGTIAGYLLGQSRTKKTNES